MCKNISTFRRKIGRNINYIGAGPKPRSKTGHKSHIFVSNARKFQLMQSYFKENENDWDLIEEPLGKIQDKKIFL